MRLAASTMLVLENLTLFVVSNGKHQTDSSWKKTIAREISGECEPPSITQDDMQRMT